MLSKNDIKVIKALEQKKFRTLNGLFVAEGHKLVNELLGKFKCIPVAATPQWDKFGTHIPADRFEPVSADELKRASLLKNPQDVLAVFKIPEYSGQLKASAKKNLVIALDDIQDPGNLGTIVRIADWFGISDIFCSKGTADIYNPKSIQATMGAIARVHVHYVDLEKELEQSGKEIPVYGTFLDGENMYRKELSPTGVIVMGNEGNGISKAIEKNVTEKLFIPAWPENAETSESLNVAIATAVVCAEFRRRN